MRHVLLFERMLHGSLPTLNHQQRLAVQSHSALASGQDNRQFALKTLDKMWTIPGDFLDSSLSAFA